MMQTGTQAPAQAMRTDWHTTADDIVACFHLLLGRNPNPEESGHFDRIGTELGAVVASFVNSYEFALRGLRERSYGADLQIAQWNGFKIFVSPHDADVGSNVLAGAYEPHVASVFASRLRPGMTALDIGANIGFFTMLAASLVGPAGRVYAVEPNPENARMIEASRRLNRFEQVKVLQTAAGREFGILMLNSTFSNGTTAVMPDDMHTVLDAKTVMVSPLDALVQDAAKIDFVKIDVEGCEAAALEGLKGRILRDHPVIASEFSPGLLPGMSQRSGREYLGFLVGLGYHLTVVNKDMSQTPCGQNIDSVMAAYAASGVDHIDILAE